MGMGRKRKRKIILRALVLLAAAAALALGITAYRIWKPGPSLTPSSQGDTGDTAGTGPLADGTGRGTEDTQEETASTETDSATEKESMAETGPGTEKDTGETKENETGHGEETEKEDRQYAVTVTNKDVFAEQVMSSRAYLLDKRLTDYVEKKKIRATEGTILDVAVASDNASCIEFYVELNNKKKTLLTLRWDPYKVTVTVAKCQYSKKEIEDAVWTESGARDISQEEDEDVISRGTEAAESEETGDGAPGNGKEVVLE